MSDFVFLRDIFCKTSRRWAAVEILRRFTRRQWMLLAMPGIPLLAAMAWQLAFLTRAPAALIPMTLSVVPAIATGLVFDRIRRQALAVEYQLFPGAMRVFAKDCQYFRYLRFRQLVDSSARGVEVAHVRRFLDLHMETVEPRNVYGHWMVAFLIACLVAVLSGVTSALSNSAYGLNLAVVSTLAIVPVVVLTATVVSERRTERDRLLEFRRFLQWHEAEQQSQRRPGS